MQQQPGLTDEELGLVAPWHTPKSGRPIPVWTPHDRAIADAQLRKLYHIIQQHYADAQRLNHPLNPAYAEACEDILSIFPEGIAPWEETE